MSILDRVLSADTNVERDFGPYPRGFATFYRSSELMFTMSVGEEFTYDEWKKWDRPKPNFLAMRTFDGICYNRILSGISMGKWQDAKEPSQITYFDTLLAINGKARVLG